MKNKLLALLAALLFCVGVVFSQTDTPIGQEQPIGQGYTAKIEVREFGKRFMLIKFPEAQMETPQKYGEGVLTALVLVFKCESFRPKCTPDILLNKDETNPAPLYVDTTGARKYRINIYPLRASEDDRTVTGIAITLTAIPEEKRF